MQQTLTPEQKNEFENRAQATQEQIKIILEDNQVVFSVYPAYEQNEKGGFELSIKTTFTDLKYSPKTEENKITDISSETTNEITSEA